MLAPSPRYPLHYNNIVSMIIYISRWPMDLDLPRVKIVKNVLEHF